jgi:hypothetical protein
MSWLAAAELRAGVVLVEHDWHLHVQDVRTERGRVAIVTAEFPDFALHRGAGELVEIAPVDVSAGDVSRVEARPGDNGEETATGVRARAA